MAYHIRSFYAHNTILTNLHPDHLDWHRDLSEYYNAKLNLLAHTKNIILYPASVVSVLPDLPHFPIESIVLKDDFVIENNLLPLTPEVFIDLSDTQLHGRHNAINIFFAASLAFRLGMPAKTLSATLSTIPPLPHRLEKVSDRGGRIWIEDSKSTTAQSLYAALEAFSPTRVHLIAGGKNKGDPFDGLPDRLRNHCAQCVAIGETKSLFLQACHEAFVPCISVATMQEAVDYMLQNTKEGDIIILSP
jgi:UDP-N-acetylmuramoylalanine--D-glutamate ligase